MAMPSPCAARVVATHGSCAALKALIGCWLAGEPAPAGSEEGHCVPQQVFRKQEASVKDFSIGLRFPTPGGLI